MTGKFDRPLGMPDAKPASTKTITRYLLVLVSVFIVGAIGFALNGYVNFSGNDADIRVQQSGNVNQGDQLEDNKKTVGGFTKRPNLPIDENARGLVEILVPDDDNIPTIVPRRRPDNIIKRQVLAHLPDPELLNNASGNNLPIISPDGLRALDVYSRQADTEGNFGVARIVIILGGLGISQSSTEQAIRTLPAGVTLAFAPYGNSLTRWMRSARKQGHELLLQVPMEPFGYPQTTAGKRSLLSSVDVQKNQENLHWSLGRITNYVGVMNYLGGKMMSVPDRLAPVFDELSERGLMFVDDGSVRNSIAERVAKSSDLPFARAHLTIDTLRTRAAISGKLKELETMAKRSGLAIGVATAFPDTISQIAIFLKNAKLRGLELTPVSAIASQPKG